MFTRLNRAAAMTIAFVAATATMSACSDNPVAPTPVENAATLTINVPGAVVYEADAVVMTAVFRNAAGEVVPNAPIVWTVDDTLRVMQGANGYLLALKNGVVKVTATSSGISASYNLTIVRAPVQNIAVLLPVPQITVGDVATVGVRVDGPGGRFLTGRAVTITSDNPNVASIDASGRVRAVAAGTATIRATAEGVSGTAQVTVAGEPTTLNLSKLDGNSLPKLLSADTVWFEGVREFHEVYLESGVFSLSGSPLRYNIAIRFAEYNVTMVNGRREMQLRYVNMERDRGLVAYDARGDLRLTSEIVYPLSHAASPISGGMQMTYRFGGSDETMHLFFRREPQ